MSAAASQPHEEKSAEQHLQQHELSVALGSTGTRANPPSSDRARASITCAPGVPPKARPIPERAYLISASTLSVQSRIEVVLRSSPWLARVYRLFKLVLRMMTGTSELLRLCLTEATASTARNSARTVPAPAPASAGTCAGAAPDNDNDSSNSRIISNNTCSNPRSDCDENDDEDCVSRVFGASSSVNTAPLLTFELPEDFPLSPDFLIKVEQVILYSRELALERKALMSPECLLSAVIDAIAYKKLFIATSSSDSPPVRRQRQQRRVAEALLRCAVTALRRQYELRISLDAEANTACETGYPVHERQLRSLWEGMMTAMPGESAASSLPSPQPLPALRGEHWAKLGFQGRDPSTDFRGTGVLGLDVLVQMSRPRRRAVAQRLLRDSEDPESWYSYALVVINVTAYALGALRAGRLRRLLAAEGATRETFIAFVAHVLCVFHADWMARRAAQSVTVLDFERVFRLISQGVDARLLAGETSSLVEMRIMVASE